MTSRNTWRAIRWAVVVALGSLGVAHVWRYATNKQPPSVVIAGIFEGACVKDKASFSVDVLSVCSLCEFDLAVDGVPFPLKNKKIVGYKKSHVPVVLDTKKMDNGRHTLEIKTVDGGWHKAGALRYLSFEVDNRKLELAFDDSKSHDSKSHDSKSHDSKNFVKQGQSVHLKCSSNKRDLSIKSLFMGSSYSWGTHNLQPTTYECFMPVDCDLEPGVYPVEVVASDRAGRIERLTTQVKVVENKFPRQRGFSVAQQKIDSERESSVADSVLEELIAEFYHDAKSEKLWRGSFELPTVVQRISTPFGEIRTTPVKGRYLHRAIDIVNEPKKVVWASQTGRVIAKDRFHLMGNTVVLDHGLGIITIYSHLDSFSDISCGDMLTKGRPIGTIGKTGYASGYHLHFELRINNTPVDPLHLLENSA